MNINYWDCEYGDYDEQWDGETEIRLYGCTHPKGNGACLLDNKYGGDKADCPLLNKEKTITVLTVK